MKEKRWIVYGTVWELGDEYPSPTIFGIYGTERIARARQTYLNENVEGVEVVEIEEVAV